MAYLKREHKSQPGRLALTVPFFKIEELEEQCGEINREKEKNTQLKRRIEELESEVREKEMVSRELGAAPCMSPALHGDLCHLFRAGQVTWDSGNCLDSRIENQGLYHRSASPESQSLTGRLQPSV